MVRKYNAEVEPAWIEQQGPLPAAAAAVHARQRRKDTDVPYVAHLLAVSSLVLEAGVKIHLYRPRFLHAKHISVDGDLCAIGSSNLDMRSFTLNEEDMILFYDRGVVADLARIQERVEAGALAESAA